MSTIALNNTLMSRIINSFERRLDRLWRNQSVYYNYREAYVYVQRGYVLFKDFYLRTKGQRTWSSKDQGL